MMWTLLWLLSQQIKLDTWTHVYMQGYMRIYMVCIWTLFLLFVTKWFAKGWQQYITINNYSPCNSSPPRISPHSTTPHHLHAVSWSHQGMDAVQLPQAQWQQILLVGPKHHFSLNMNSTTVIPSQQVSLFWSTCSQTLPLFCQCWNTHPFTATALISLLKSSADYNMLRTLPHGPSPEHAPETISLPSSRNCIGLPVSQIQAPRRDSTRHLQGTLHGSMAPFYLTELLHPYTPTRNYPGQVGF